MADDSRASRGFVAQDTYDKYTDSRTSRGFITNAAYDKYIGGQSSFTKSKFEDRSFFRGDLSQYNMNTGTVIAGKNCKFDAVNCSGVPTDFDHHSSTLYVDGSDAHTLLIGATGSKKSRLVVMPTVRTMAASGEDMVICDPKGEIYRRTAGYLSQKGYDIHAINLREPNKGDGWNLLQIPYEHYVSGEIDKACELINDAAVSLIPIVAKDPYWDYSARDMLFGLVILLFQIAADKKMPADIVNMRSVLKLREELFYTSNSWDIMHSDLWEYAKKHELIRMRLHGVVICPEKTLSCIVSTFDQHLSCFSLQPQIIDLLSRSTFDLTGFGFSKTAIYLIMPDEKTTFHKIIGIFVKQMYEFLIDNAFKKTEYNRFDTRINFILDEFSSLPAITDFPQMISASRSRNIRFILVVQSKHQLRQRYKDETDTIMSNCINWMFLTSRETELLREISELSGTTGKNNEPLVSISRLQHLDKDRGECLIFNGRKYPYIATLPDIEIYDKNIYQVFTMKPRTQVSFVEGYEKSDFFRDIIKQEEYNEISLEDDESMRSEPTDTKNNMTSKELADIQKELEAKFDELFGPLDEEDD